MEPSQAESSLPEVPGRISSRDPWSALNRFTRARIALGRSGSSWRTETLLGFRLTHAQARDAVYKEFEAGRLVEELHQLEIETVCLATQARTRAEYLKRPDLGRRLSEDSRKFLCTSATAWGKRQLSVVISDGLSSLAAEAQAVATLAALLPLLSKLGWSVYPIFIVPFARVKLQDEIGSLLGARHSLILLGERPGLGAPDSLGAYFVFQPGSEKTDADRNCLSNIRSEGLSPPVAAQKLAQLLSHSEAQGCSGVRLKEGASQIKD